MVNHVIKLLSIYTYVTDKVHWTNTMPHDINIISYQIDGQYDHFFEHGNLQVKKDTVFNIAPQEHYSVQKIKKGTSICVTFTSDTPIKTEAIDCSSDPRFSILFQKLLSYKSIGIKSNYYMALSIIYEILSLLSKNSFESKKNSTHDAFSQVHDYLLNNFYNSNIDLSEISKNSGLSDKYFRESFKKRYGCSPTQFLINLRLNEAAKLLTLGFLSVNEVAEAVGINDVYYFSRLFKKKFNIPPSQFKK